MWKVGNKEEGEWVGPRTPPPRLPLPLPLPLPLRDKEDDGHQQQGRKRSPDPDSESLSSPNKRNHLWCPKATSSSSGGGTVAAMAELPVTRCPCGIGTCRVFTSHSQNNPGRRYYTCPASPLRCGFFKWCDDIVKHTVPACPCGAGTSSLNRHLSGPHAGRWYFACRIKKNHGACTFYQLVDSELNFLLNKFLPRLECNPSPSCSATATATSQHTPAAENDDSIKEQETKMPNSGDLDTDKHLIMKETDSLVLARAVRTHQLIFSTSVIHLQQRKFWNAADNSLAAETVGQLLGIKFEGWLGRIVFSPPRLLKDPAALSFFWCVFPSFYPIPCLEDDNAEVVTMTSDESSETEPLTQPQQAPLSLSSIIPEFLAGEDLVMVASDRVDEADAQLQQAPQRNDLHLSSFLSDPYEVESLACTKTEIALSELVLRCSGPGGVLSLLQSMPVSDHEKMLEVAESIFNSWRCVGVNCGPFSEVVKEYVHYVSRQAGVEAAMSRGPSSQQLDAIYHEEKAEFNHVCQLHREMEAALEASEKELISRQGEASRLRDTLMRLEKGIAESEAGIAELKSRVVDRYGEKIDAEARMQGATRKMREVLELEQQREMEKNGARGVMERLRGLLQHQ